MNQHSFITSLWCKSPNYSVAAPQVEEASQLQVVVLPMPDDAQPSGIVHVGGVGSSPAC